MVSREEWGLDTFGIYLYDFHKVSIFYFAFGFTSRVKFRKKAVHYKIMVYLEFHFLLLLMGTF